MDQLVVAVVDDLDRGLHTASRDVQHFGCTVMRDRCANLRSVVRALPFLKVASFAATAACCDSVRCLRRRFTLMTEPMASWRSYSLNSRTADRLVHTSVPFKQSRNIQL